MEWHKVVTTGAFWGEDLSLILEKISILVIDKNFKG